MTIEATDRMAKARAAKVAKAQAKEVTMPGTASPIEEDDATRRKRDALLTQLADLPAVQAPAKAQPGSIIGSGVGVDKVPFTREWFLDVDARKVEIPGYQLHDVYDTSDDIPPDGLPINVQGVVFSVLKGITCKLPTTHYAVYMDSKRSRDRLNAIFAPPTNPKDGMKVHVMGTGPLEARPE